MNRRPATLRQSCLRLASFLVEEHGADAVLVVVTRQRRRATETLAVPFGNAHTVRGITEYAYGILCGDPEDEDEIEPKSNDDEASE